MSPSVRIYRKLNWLLIICYLALTLFGWINIYASTFNAESAGIFSLANQSGVQLVWIGAGVIAALLILFVINPKVYIELSWWFYAVAVLSLIAVLIAGKEVNGSRSWLPIWGGFGIQPAEFSKITTAICLAVTMSRYGFRLSSVRDFAKAAGVILVPALLISIEPEFGTLLVYCGLIFMFYREGMSGWVLAFIGAVILLFICTLKYSPFVSVLVAVGMFGIMRAATSGHFTRYFLYYGAFITAAAFLPELLDTGFMKPVAGIAPEYWLLIISVPFLMLFIVRGYRRKIRYWGTFLATMAVSVALIFSVDFIFRNVLKEHHRDRIENLLGITQDLKGAGYNVNQSKIAIGSGGFAGKGFLEGTQTKFNFVPEQSTDFIFCAIGEEWGFLGSALTLSLYFILISGIAVTAEKQRDKFVRIYGYSLASYLFVHVFINIGMTIGIMPVVGIPLPFISYGGSSFLTFTIMLFIFLRLDIERWRY